MLFPNIMKFISLKGALVKWSWKCASRGILALVSFQIVRGNQGRKLCTSQTRRHDFNRDQVFSSAARERVTAVEKKIFSAVVSIEMPVPKGLWPFTHRLRGNANIGSKVHSC